MQVADFGRPLPPLRSVGDKRQFLCPRCLEEVKTSRLHNLLPGTVYSLTWMVALDHWNKLGQCWAHCNSSYPSECLLAE